MIIQLENGIGEGQIENIMSEIKQLKYAPNQVVTQNGEYLICIGKDEVDPRLVGSIKGVKDIHRVSDAYKLVSSKWKVGKTSIDLGGDVKIGNGDFQLMAGPCSIENEDQIECTVKHLVENNIRIMRGGVFKPRSSPYSFQGLGIDGLKLFYKHCQENGIKIITEVMELDQVQKMHDYVDIFQVGARNSQNFNLLSELGKVDKAVMLKRGISGTLDELLHSAEYIFSSGNEKIMLCERGIRSYEKAYRNTMDINALAILRERTHLPIIADPSHGIGIRKYVTPVALACVMAGADGVIMEVHEVPQKAFSDGQQTLSHKQAVGSYDSIRATREHFLKWG
ncbi:MAG: 3-deoxy-7-phosphoheptulonate synthase [Patiriisocius sp.]|jgi:3-deoxy-7-phosphoheptulonate synthase